MADKVRDQVSRAVGLQLGEGYVSAVDEVLAPGSDATKVVLSHPAKIVSMVSVLTAPAMHAALGPRKIGQDTDTPSTVIVALADDNQTLTFEDTVSTVRVKYLPIPVNGE